MIPPQDGQKTGQRIVGDASHVRSTPAAAHNQLGQDEVCKRILVRTVVNLGIKLNFQQLIFLGSYPIIGNLEIDASTKHHVCHSLFATGFRQPSKIKVLIFKLLSDSVVVMVILLKNPIQFEVRIISTRPTSSDYLLWGCLTKIYTFRFNFLFIFEV